MKLFFKVNTVAFGLSALLLRSMLSSYTSTAPKFGQITIAIKLPAFLSAANDALHQFPFSLPYSGYVAKSSGMTVKQGADGYFWIIGIDSAKNARAISFASSNVSPEASYNKTYGFSVRCVAKDYQPPQTTLSINSHSHFRTQAMYLEILVRPSTKAQAATSGLLAYVPTLPFGI